MNKISNSYISYAEIQYNLSIMETTLNRKVPVDKGFIAIFERAIEALQDPAEKKGELSSRLDASRIKITEVQQQPSISSMQTFASGLANPLKKEFVMKLSEQFDYKPIAGDGHCLFRSIGTGMIMNLLNQTPDERQRFLSHLEKNMIALESAKNSKGLLTQYQDFKKQLETGDPSNSSVQFLRTLASAYNSLHPTETLHQEVLSTCPNGQMDDYLEQMENTSKYGGEPEIIALAQTLGIQLKILDVDCKGVEQATPHWNVFDPDTAPLMTVSLLYSGKNHYDLLCMRK